MCLAIPSKIIEIDNDMGTVDADGVKRKVSLILIDNPKIGDYVIVHAGFAIQRIDEEAAFESLSILREVVSFADQEK